MSNYKYIFFDADDTLWENEWYFRDAERKFSELFKDYASKEEIVHTLWKKQEDNIPMFGYGSKTYLIGMLDTAHELYKAPLPEDLYLQVKQIIQDLAFHELQVYEGVEETLASLSQKYRLAVVTKGDLTEQLTKYQKSGLSKYFHHIEVVPNKTPEDYYGVISKLDIEPKDILMVGNSVRSDIAPVIEIGATAVYIPSENIWIHEVMDLPSSERIIELSKINQLLEIL